ncbi:D-alanyl-D-alanine carboxypeptidase family protein [Anaerotignum sp.]|nr:D-alanyl-D-alanine carboxypeptidase family protein [Anaerotignum sp.]MBQ7758426.1 D-alanyl-D-alanine carboxypeptidase [Anaerotignum sp.]
MKRMTLLLLLFLLSATPVFASEPNVAAQGAALIDGKTGRLLWEKNGEEPFAMASTTKIMTAILVLENTDLEDIVTISKNAAHQPEVHMDLKEGEQWKVGDLLSAMMLRSYNDAAVALAEHVSGDVESFCERMTEKAKEIGAMETVFGSPNGLDSHLTDEQHHSTAYDMSLIAAYALENETFREIIAQGEINVADLEGKHLCNVTNADRFLKEYQGALGVKTGYTNKAGHCFVGAAEREDVLLVSTVLGSGWGTAGKEKKWTDTKVLMDYGFETFHTYEAVKAEQIFGEVKIADSPTELVETVLAEGYTALFSEEEIEELRLEADLPKEVEAPVEKGEKLGKATLWLEDEKLAEIDLLALETAYSYTLRERLWRLAENWLTWRKF